MQTETIIGLTEQAEAIADTIKSAMNKSLTNVTFCSIKNYINDKGEKSDYLINIGVNYQTQKEKDIKFLTELDVFSMNWNCPIDDIVKAQIKLVENFQNPNPVQSQAQKDAYIVINHALKVHADTLELYVFGSKVRKTIREAVDYGEDKRQPLTKAQDELKALLKHTKYRLFKFKLNGMKMRTNGEELSFDK